MQSKSYKSAYYKSFNEAFKSIDDENLKKIRIFENIFKR